MSVDDASTFLLFIPVPVIKVGVFVNASVKEIVDSARQLGLETVQLHGNEPAEMLAQLPSHLSIVSAYRCGPQGLLPLADYLDQCRAHGRLPDAVLIDAEAEATDEYGGTGRLADWRRIAAERELLGGFPLILAGGLNPENVAAAIETVRPDGVDVASGVESSPGKKDAAKMRDFVAAARAAFDRV